MADWNEPASLTTAYATVLSVLKARDLDAAQLFDSAPTNPAEGMIRYVRASNKFQEYLAGVWTDKVLSIAGGGTGSTTAGGAVTALGLGTIATQNANNVTITGGTAALASVSGAGSGLTGLNASELGSGTVPLARITGLLNAQIDNAAAIAWSKINKAGSSIADLATRSASDLSSGTLPDARFPATLPALNGSALTNLTGANISTGINAAAITAGTVAAARLGSGTPDATTFLRGDGSWQVIDVQSITRIEHLNGTITNGNTTVDVTVQDVGAWSRAYLVPNGSVNDNGVHDNMIYTKISTTLVRVERDHSAGATDVEFTVISYDAVP